MFKSLKLRLRPATHCDFLPSQTTVVRDIWCYLWFWLYNCGAACETSSRMAQCHSLEMKFSQFPKLKYSMK